MKIQLVSRSKHTISRLQNTNQLMQYSEIIAVCSQIHTKYTNALCGQRAKIYFLNLNLVVHKVTTKHERVKDLVNRINY